MAVGRKLLVESTIGEASSSELTSFVMFSRLIVWGERIGNVPTVNCFV